MAKYSVPLHIEVYASVVVTAPDGATDEQIARIAEEKGGDLVERFMETKLDGRYGGSASVLPMRPLKVFRGHRNPSIEEDIGIDNPYGYRVPTDDEIAAAWRYIENEYTLKEGNVDGEQWAEGLAFGRPIGELAKVDPSWHRELMAAAKHVRPQLTEDQWAMIAARADRLRADQGEVAKFKTAVKNPWLGKPLSAGDRVEVSDGKWRWTGEVVSVNDFDPSDVSYDVKPDGEKRLERVKAAHVRPASTPQLHSPQRIR
ncbi:MAG TPA: hypothetical protein VFO62_00930 [Candidatus Binatia bacterium]|nr:hypothetical protein [Candidatus Binatia bacterium]